MTQLSYGQLMGYAIAAGFPVAVAPVMAAIAEAESSGNPDATHVNTNGSTDSGLWQINTVNSGVIAQYGNVFDPLSNARMAHAIYSGQGLSAWSTYNSGAYRSHLVGGATAVPVGGTGSGGTVPPVGTPYSATVAKQAGYTGQPTGWKDWLKAFAGPLGGSAINQIPGLGGSPSPAQALGVAGSGLDGIAAVVEYPFVHWKQIVTGLAGVALLLIGLFLWDRRSIDSVVSAGTKLASTAAIA